MEQKEFVKLCTKIFKDSGFEKKGMNYYLEATDDIVIVFGLQSSAYGGHCYYIEYGFVFKSINKYMPYPKYYQANIRQGRVGINNFYAMEYENISEDDFTTALLTAINKMVEVGSGGKEKIVSFSLNGETRATLIQGYDVLPYLGTDKTVVHVAPD